MTLLERVQDFIKETLKMYKEHDAIASNKEYIEHIITKAKLMIEYGYPAEFNFRSNKWITITSMEIEDYEINTCLGMDELRIAYYIIDQQNKSKIKKIIQTIDI